MSETGNFMDAALAACEGDQLEVQPPVVADEEAPSPQLANDSEDAPQ